jgi:hypothetical protein
VSESLTHTDGPSPPGKQPARRHPHSWGSNTVPSGAGRPVEQTRALGFASCTPGSCWRPSSVTAICAGQPRHAPLARESTTEETMQAPRHGSHPSSLLLLRASSCAVHSLVGVASSARTLPQAAARDSRPYRLQPTGFMFRTAHRNITTRGPQVTDRPGWAAHRLLDTGDEQMSRSAHLTHPPSLRQCTS